MRISIAILFLALVTSVLLADNILIIEAGPPGGGCLVYADCQPRVCVNGICTACTANGQCPTTNLCNITTGNCVACTSGAQCDSGYCDLATGKCSPCTLDTQCPTDLCKAGVCSSCAADGDCVTNLCIAGTCMQCSSDDQCAAGVCTVAGVCQSCTIAGCPPTAPKCNAATGKCSGRSRGEACAASSECDSRFCLSGVCSTCTSSCPAGKCDLVSGRCICNPGDLICLGILGKEAVAPPPGTITQPPEVVVKEERKGIIIQLFGLGATQTYAVKNCIRGAPCATDDDCCGGNCITNVCLCGISACSSSGECCSGYCESGLCKQPPSMSFFVTETIRRPAAQLGCAGLVEQCLPGEMGCLYFCNAVTGILAFVAVGVGLLVWRSAGHPVPGIAAAAVPVIIAFATYPFVGVVVGILIVGLIFAR